MENRTETTVSGLGFEGESMEQIETTPSYRVEAFVAGLNPRS